MTARAGIAGLCTAFLLTTLPPGATYAAPPRPFDPHFRPPPHRPYGPGIHRPGPRGHWHWGIGIFSNDRDAFRWLAFTAITIKVLDNLNEAQRREHEAAQIEAAEAEVGETITWHQDDASGSITVTRDGTSSSGRYCREFQHKIIIGGKQENAYGTACRNPDGTWQVVSPR